MITLIIMGTASLSSAAGRIADGIFIDGVDVSGMTPEQAKSAVYENGSQTGPGVWEGGDPVSKEEFALVEYPPIQEVIYTKPNS